MMLGLLSEELTLCFFVLLLTCAFNEASTAMVSAKLALLAAIASVRQNVSFLMFKCCIDRFFTRCAMSLIA